MDVLDCYFGALGDGQVVVTGAKPCFQVPAVVFMPIGLPWEAEGAWQGAPVGGSDPASANVRHKWVHVKWGAVCQVEASGIRGDAQILRAPLPSRSTTF